MSKKRNKGKFNRKANMTWVLWVVIPALCALLIFGMIKLGSMMLAQRTYRDLADSVEQAKPVATEPPATEPVVAPTETVEVPTAPPVTEPQILPQYQALYEENPDLFGWIKIEDTKINYPVMYAPQDLEKYLHTDFHGKYYYGGTPYMDVRCTPDSENYIIYGHNMSDGSMFKGLMKYEKEKYWKEHPIAQFDTLYEEGEYEVVAAFYDQVYRTADVCFKFYNVIELDDENAYNDAIRHFKAKSLYDTGVTPEYGTQLVTLVTCAYHTDNGKFVVVLAEKTE